MSTALVKLAENTGVSTEEITEVVRSMIISSKNQNGATATNAEMAVVSGICSKYQLNPMMREAHAFISGGKLQVMIGIDGWLKILNRQEDFDGYEQFDNFNDKGELESVLTKIYVKGRKFPTPHTEYMDEAFQPNSAAWKKFRKRMLAGKSLGQCVRKAFGISEVIDDDEAGRIRSNGGSNSPAQERDITPRPSVNLTDIDVIMAECVNLDELKQSCGSIREEMQANGTWDGSKAEIIALNIKHKDRINSVSAKKDEPIYDQDTGEDITETEQNKQTESIEAEAIEGELLSSDDGDIKSTTKTKRQSEVDKDSPHWMSQANDDDDVGFGDDDEFGES